MSGKKKKGGANLPVVTPVDKGGQQQLSLEQVLSHPVVKQMHEKLEEMRALVAGLPEAVGRAVAAHQAAGRAQPRGFLPVTIKGDNEGVEFHRKGLILQSGQVVAKEGLMDRPAIPVSGPATLGIVKIKKGAAHEH